MTVTFIKPFWAFLIASFTWLSTTIADLPSWMQESAVVLLVSALGYGCWTLRNDVLTQRRELTAEISKRDSELSALNKEIRDEFKAQSEELIATLRNLRQ